MAKSKNNSKESCAVCSNYYVQYENKVVPDSHFCYTHYFSCPKCQYNPQLEIDVSEIIETGIVAEIVDGRIKYNYEELLEAIRGKLTRHIKSLENKNENRWDCILRYSSNITEVLIRNIKGTFNSCGNLKSNTQELSDLANKEIIELWKRYGASEEEWLKEVCESWYLK